MASAHTENTVDLEVLVDLEQQFYNVGYADGVEHGKIHGRIEGRELGREKGFEMWEELGYYEGFARLWKTASERKEGKDSRVSHTAKLLLDLIAQFPMENPAHTESAELDIPKLFGQIRARYKMLCTFVGVKPSLRASQAQAPAQLEGHGASGAADDSGAATGPRKKRNVWAVATAENQEGIDYSF